MSPRSGSTSLAKGDRTRNRDRVHATLLAQGCASGLLDNTTINAPETYADDLAHAMAGVDAFIDAAHEAERPVLVIDDGGLLALIAAAEAGYPTYRAAADALQAVRPFVVVGTTGKDALTAETVPLLPDGVVLAPYATRDFALLASDPELADTVEEIPGVGRRYRLRGGAQVTILGDGRSLNLFESDAIPNQGYDAYRAGTLIAAKAFCAQADTTPAGVHADLVDDVIAASGLYDDYHDTYLAAGVPARAASTGPTGLAGMAACVVGYGAAGRLHAQLLTDAGAQLTILDPKHQDLPKTYRSFRHGVDDLPAAVAAGIGLWSVCCPTADHLPVLQSILTQDPAERVLLEKPACQGHEIDAFTRLLDEHPNARVMSTRTPAS
ncbi:hypothetical protein FHR32_006110 [Streptosporangium album]|uniref:Uncharacterized protein n=1 Tax=Streptosporangium album TaxID=47479 RepID=A0A7W7S0N9_9ACTN|nr:hypothetical protein [Streptosporangium album]MBB4941733.1 hypothetical protein [Streptosporangium album]